MYTVKCHNVPGTLYFKLSSLVSTLLYIVELLFKLFEPMIGSNSIQYANGLDWEERRKWLYATLRGKSLEEYIPIFVKV